MPERRRIADKSAALAVIRELHQRGELNEHLQPVNRDPDSEEEDEEEGAEEKKAGTEKKSKYYLDEVQCLALSVSACYHNSSSYVFSTINTNCVMFLCRYPPHSRVVFLGMTLGITCTSSSWRRQAQTSRSSHSPSSHLKAPTMHLEYLPRNLYLINRLYTPQVFLVIITNVMCSLCRFQNFRYMRRGLRFVSR